MTEQNWTELWQGAKGLAFIGIWAWMIVISHSVAVSRGRSGTGLALATFLLGPLGLVVAFILPINQDSIERRLIRAGKRYRCFFCRELLRMKATRCCHCAADQPEV